MDELFVDGAINHDVLKEDLGDDYYNDPGTNSVPTKMFENVPDRATLLKVYANSQRKLSDVEAGFAKRIKDDGMIKIPGEKSTEDEIKAYRTATGVPESVDGYAMDIPPGDDEESFTGVAAAVKDAALAAGIPASAVTAVWGKVVETMQGQFKALEDKGLALMASEETAMKDLHKEKYGTFISGTDAALAKFKDGAAVKALLNTYGIANSPAIRNMLAEIAPLVNEGKTVFGELTNAKETGGFPTYEYDESGKPID